MMKKVNFSFLVFSLFVVLIVVSPFAGFAQPGNPGGDPDAPITGIEILLAAGGVLGIKKMYNARKNRPE